MNMALCDNDLCILLILCQIFELLSQLPSRLIPPWIEGLDDPLNLLFLFRISFIHSVLFCPQKFLLCLAMSIPG